MDNTNLIQNEVLNCILARRSTRIYQERQIDELQLDTILNAAIWALSGGNNQTWLFTAIQNRCFEGAYNLLRSSNRVYWKGIISASP